METSIDKFRRHVSALGGIYYRIDSGYMSGRNATATDSALDWHYREAKRTFSEACQNESDPLPEYLDSARGGRLAAKWFALERRYNGIKS